MPPKASLTSPQGIRNVDNYYLVIVTCIVTFNFLSIHIICHSDYLLVASVLSRLAFSLSSKNGKIESERACLSNAPPST